MSFLNLPIFWLGAIAVSIPIVIHLLNKRKFDKVVWAAMRFLKISVEQNQRRIQIEDILLLLLRCLVLVFLGMALARPTLGCSAAGNLMGHQDVTGVIILDNSYSMSGTDGVRSRFEQAKIAAAQALDTMPSGSSVAVILASDVASPVIPEPTHDLVKVRRAITEARLCSRGSNLYPAVRMAIDTLKGRSAVRKEIYLLTDGQLVAWRQLGEIQKLLDGEKNEIRTSVVFVGGHEDENVAVSQLRMASGLAAVNRELYFAAEVRNYGSKPAESVRITLRVDSEAPSDEQTISQIPAGGSKTVSLRAKLREEGYHTVTAAIPADHLPADDVRTIAVRAINQAKVLLVDGAPARNARDDETYYLREALQPVARGARDQYFMKVTTVSSAELDQQKFDGYDAVIVANVADFSQRTLESLADYLRRGGGLMIFPGEATSASFYNENLVHKYHFLPAALGAEHGDPARRDKFFTLQNKQFQHPIASIWSDPANGTPASAEFYKAYELVPDDDPAAPGDKYAAEAGKPRVVLSFAGGAGDDSLKDKPAVMERNWGLGRVILFASTAGSKWSTLPVAAQGGVFLPLIDRTVASIVQRQDEALNIRVGDTFVFHPGDEAIGKEALFFKPGQKEEATDSRQIELPRSGAGGGGVPTLTYNQTDIAGEYVARMPYGPPVKFAAQIESDNNESSLDELSKQQTDQLAQACSVTRWAPGENLSARIETARTGTELWTHMAWILLILATGEMFLARWFSRSK
jgi:hypothetical protein